MSTCQLEVEADVHDGVESQGEEVGSSEFSKPVQDPKLLYANEHHKVNDKPITLTMLAVDDDRFNGAMVGSEMYVVTRRKENIPELMEEVVPGVAEFMPVHVKSGPGVTIAPDKFGRPVGV